MKHLIIIAALFVLSSCEVLFPPITFKIIGSGSFSVGYTDSQISKVWQTGATTFDVEMLTNETWVLSASSINGTGVTVEAYQGTELIRKQSVNGYGIASISGTY